MKLCEISLDNEALMKILISYLQEKVAKTACMSACKHIATSLKDFLLDNNVTQMTIPALMQFSLDLVQCEGKLKV